MIRPTFVTYLLLITLFSVSCTFASNADVNRAKREEILLNDDDITHLLNEMHGFLVTIQQVTEGMENDDFSQIINAAKSSGTSSIRNVPENLKSTLPMEFKKMGYATRKTFDQLAMDAEQFGDKEHTLSQLNQVLTLCTECHSKYKVE